MVIDAIQWWTGDVWRTIYMSTWEYDVVDTYSELVACTKATLRMVRFGVDNYDFIATQARDFAVLDYRG